MKVGNKMKVQTQAVVLSSNKETMQDLGRGPLGNLFTGKDHSIVREAVGKLDKTEHTIVLMRFWEQNTISEIAEILDLSWTEVESRLTQALEKLKAFCLSKADFSRNQVKVPTVEIRQVPAA